MRLQTEWEIRWKKFLLFSVLWRSFRLPFRTRKHLHVPQKCFPGSSNRWWWVRLNSSTIAFSWFSLHVAFIIFNFTNIFIAKSDGDESMLNKILFEIKAIQTRFGAGRYHVAEKRCIQWLSTSHQIICFRQTGSCMPIWHLFIASVTQGANFRTAKNSFLMCAIYNRCQHIILFEVILLPLISKNVERKIIFDWIDDKWDIPLQYAVPNEIH